MVILSKSLIKTLPFLSINPKDWAYDLLDLVELSTANSSLLISETLLFNNADTPLNASLPAIVVITAVFSLAVKPSSWPFISLMPSINLPSVISFWADCRLYFSIQADIFSVGEAILVNRFFKAVPAFSALTPLLAIKPKATDKSLIDIPNVPAIGATLVNADCIWATLVLELVDAAANISTKSVAWDADIPKAVKPSVTKSLACAKSISATVAKLRTPSRPLIISLVSQPAIPI